MNNGSSYISTRTEALFQFGFLSTVVPFQGTLETTEGYRSTVVTGLPWSLENGIYTGPGGLGHSPWVEVVEYEYADGITTQTTSVWLSDSAYTSCRAVNPNASFVPTGIPLIPDSEFNVECIDTDALGDGWGWTGLESCAIDVVCVDTDPVGDGWGWNGSSSCPVTE